MSVPVFISELGKNDRNMTVLCCFYLQVESKLRDNGIPLEEMEGKSIVFSHPYYGNKSMTSERTGDCCIMYDCCSLSENELDIVMGKNRAFHNLRHKHYLPRFKAIDKLIIFLETSSRDFMKRMHF